MPNTKCESLCPSENTQVHMHIYAQLWLCTLVWRHGLHGTVKNVLLILFVWSSVLQDPTDTTQEEHHSVAHTKRKLYKLQCTIPKADGRSRPTLDVGAVAQIAYKRHTCHTCMRIFIWTCMHTNIYAFSYTNPLVAAGLRKAMKTMCVSLGLQNRSSDSRRYYPGRTSSFGTCRRNSVRTECTMQIRKKKTYSTTTF